MRKLWLKYGGYSRDKIGLRLIQLLIQKNTYKYDIFEVFGGLNCTRHSFE